FAARCLFCGKFERLLDPNFSAKRLVVQRNRIARTSVAETPGESSAIRCRYTHESRGDSLDRTPRVVAGEGIAKSRLGTCSAKNYTRIRARQPASHSQERIGEGVDH